MSILLIDCISMLRFELYEIRLNHRSLPHLPKDLYCLQHHQLARERAILTVSTDSL